MKKMLSILLSVFMIFSCIPFISVQAADSYAEIFYDGEQVTDKIYLQEYRTAQLSVCTPVTAEDGTVSYTALDTTDGKYVTWESNLPLLANVDENGKVTAYDFSKRAIIQLWIDENIKVIPIVGDSTADAIWKAIDSSGIDLDNADTDTIVKIVAAVAGDTLAESLRTYLDNMNVEITATVYDADGNKLGSDTVEIVVEKSTLASLAPTGVHITNKKVVPTTVAVGATVQLYGACTPVRLEQGIKWSVGKSVLDTSASDYASVSEDGLVTFLAAGEVTIRVNPESTLYAAFTDTITFTVLEQADLPVTDFEISGSTSVAEGSQIQLSVDNVQPAGAYRGDLAWSSSDPTIAVVDESGTVTGLDGGSGFTEYSKTVTITATMGGVSKDVEIKVTRSLLSSSVSSVEISGDEILGIGAGAQYTADVLPARLNTSSDVSRQWGIVDAATGEYIPATADTPAQDAAASITSTGYVTAVGAGVTTIYCTATYGSSSATDTFSIVCGNAITDFEISGSVSISEGKTSQLSINVLAPDDYETSLLDYVKWSVDDDTVAYVDQNGLLLGRDAGGRNSSKTTTLHATVSGITKSVTVTVSRGWLNLSKFTDGQIEGPDCVVRDIPHAFTLSTYPTELTASATYWAIIKDDGSAPWSVSNSYIGTNRNTENSFASISDDGVVTGKSAGTTTLYGFSRYLFQSHIERTKEINVIEIAPESITLKAPDKLEYLEGDTELDLTGLEVYLNYKKESLEPYYSDWEDYTDEQLRCQVTDYTVSELKANILDSQQYIIVSVDRAGKTYNAVFSVQINSKQVDTITITPPDKSIYFEGEEFDTTGLTVTANYLNADSEEVTDYKIDYDSFSMDTFDTEQQVRVYYEHAGRTAEATFPITVYGKPVITTVVDGVLNNWTTKDIVFTLSATHDVEGVTYYWRAEGSTTWVSLESNVFTISESTNTTIYFKAKNGLGYESDETEPLKVMLDNVTPSFELSPEVTEVTNTDYKINITDLVYGISDIKSFTLNSEEIGKSDSFTVSTNGTYTVRVETNCGLSCEKSITVSNIDKEAPAVTGVTVTQDPEDAPHRFTEGDFGKYYSGDVVALPTAEDSGVAGVDYIKYRLVNPGYEAQTEWTVLGDGESAVCNSNFKGYFEFVAVDRAGNESDPFYTDGFVLDNTKPVITTLNAICGEDGDTYESGQWADDIIYFTPETDTFSGVYEYFYKIDDGKWQKLTTETLRARDDGTYVYSFKAISYSGLESDVYDFTVNIDRTVPLVRVDFEGTFGRWTNENITFTLSTLNNCPSGCTYYYSDDGINWHKLDGNVLVLNDSTNASYSFKAVNGAGLESAPSDSYKVMIDKVKPTGTVIQGVTTKTDAPYEIAIVPHVGEAGCMTVYFNGEDVTDTLKATVSENGTYALTIIGNNMLSNTIMVEISNFSVIPTALFEYEEIDSDTLTVTAYTGVAENVTVPLEIDGLETRSLSENAFLNKTSVESVNIPNTAQSIGDNCFAGCENLKKVTIPASVTEIGENVFDGCDGVTIYCYGNSAAQTYAEENNIPYVLLDLVPVGKTQINEDAGIIFTHQTAKTDIGEIVKADAYDVMAIPSFTHAGTNTYGTGSVLYFFKDGALVYTYTLIVYGDLNGDSVVDVLDIRLAEQTVNGSLTLGENFMLACDFDNCGTVEVSDYQQVVNIALR